jgi:hypothetical protein
MIVQKRISKPIIGVTNADQTSEEDSGGHDEDDQTESLEESVIESDMKPPTKVNDIGFVPKQNELQKIENYQAVLKQNVNINN